MLESVALHLAVRGACGGSGGRGSCGVKTDFHSRAMSPIWRIAQERPRKLAQSVGNLVRRGAGDRQIAIDPAALRDAALPVVQVIIEAALVDRNRADALDFHVTSVP